MLPSAGTSCPLRSTLVALLVFQLITLVLPSMMVAGAAENQVTTGSKLTASAVVFSTQIGIGGFPFMGTTIFPQTVTFSVAVDVPYQLVAVSV